MQRSHLEIKHPNQTMEHLYKTFLEDKAIYQKNYDYWNSIISSMLSAENHVLESYIDTSDGLGNELMDGNPIYHFKVRQLNKCVRIVQDEAGTNKNILFSAWINETELEENESADELYT